MNRSVSARRMSFLSADAAGVLAASFAALCCAGTPFIVGGLGALGLSFLRRDAILWPLMIAALLVTEWGMWRARNLHRKSGPLMLATLSAIALVAGVIFIHGFPAKQLIWAAVAGLLGATLWNFVERRAYRSNVSGSACD